MKVYSKWRPTGVDSPGLCADEMDRAEWLVYGGACITRDTSEGSVGASNWAVTVRELTKECGDEGVENGWEIHGFGHWGPGWFEVILCAPDSAAAKLCQGFEDSLSDYPLLDGEDHSMRESEAIYDYWANMSLRERINLCKRERVSILLARHPDPRNDRIEQRLQCWVNEG